MADINFNELNQLLASVNLNDVTAESSSGFEELSDGFYLAEVEKAELTTSKNSGRPQVAMQFSVSEDGLAPYVDEKGFAKLKTIEHTKGRKIFKYYPLVDEKSLKTFTSDMLKFEGSEPGVPLLPKEAFETGEILEEAITALIGYRIYVQVSTTVKKGTEEKQSWKNLISWKRAKTFNLPE